MSTKKNKFTILLLDSVLRTIFFIPLVFEKMKKKEKIFDPRSILIIESWGIGDLVMMSSVLKPLREHHPQARISLLAKDTARELFACSPYIDDFIVFDFPWTRFRRKYAFWSWDWKGLLATISILRQRNFDFILDARGDIRNNLLSFLIHGNRRLGYDWTGGGYFLTDAIKLNQENLHRVDAWLNLLDYIGICVEKLKPDIFVSKEEEIGAIDFLFKNGIKNGELLIGIHPGAQIKSRCWPIGRFAELAESLRNKLKAKIIVFVEPGGYGKDIPIKGEFLKARLPLRGIIGLIKQLDLLICNDSGAMHIASAVDTRTLSIFGPGAIERIGPYGSGNTLLFKAGVNCRPCFDYCKFSKPVCLENISVEMATEAAEKIITDPGYEKTTPQIL